MHLSALQPLIAAGESLTLELKKSSAEKERACRSLCAMANGQGGRMTFELPASLARSKKGSTLEETPGKTPGKTPVISSEKSSEKILHHLSAADQSDKAHPRPPAGPVGALVPMLGRRLPLKLAYN